MNKIKLFLFLIFLSTTSLFAQNLHVESLVLDENNLRAQINPKLDFNDKKCCIIMISTPNMDDAQRKRLEFSGDMGAEVVSVDFPTGEIELYVSPHAGTLKIAHPDLGVVNYNIPIDLKEIKTYKMILMSPKATPAIEESLTANYLVINIEPKDARVFIDDEFVENKNGALMKLLSIGVEHNVRIEKNLYHPLDTMVMTNASNTVTINKKLKPAFGYINVNSSPESGATVIVNGKEVGVTPFMSAELPSGEYEVRIVKAMFKQSSKTVRIIDGKTTEAELTMQPNFSEITLTSDPDATIYMDDNMVGKGSWTGKVLAGSHNVEVKKENHRDIKRTITVEAALNQTITLDNPIPIYGSLNVISDPLDATIYIDNKEVGRTPKILTQVLIGKHTVRIEKHGCTSVTKEVYLREREMTDVDAKLAVTGTAAAGNVSKKENSAKKNTTNKGVKQNETKPKTDKGFGKRTFINLNFAYSIAPQTSFGLTFGQVKRLGWYVSAMTGFDFKAFGPKLECDENGSIYGVVPYYSENTSKSRLSITAGVLFGITKNVYVKVGAGYGCRILVQQTIAGTWVKNKAYSTSGLDVSGGVQLLFGRFNMSVEAVTTNFKYSEGKIGLGINF